MSHLTQQFGPAKVFVAPYSIGLETLVVVGVIQNHDEQLSAQTLTKRDPPASIIMTSPYAVS
jgi:hypothetical protein